MTAEHATHEHRAPPPGPGAASPRSTSWSSRMATARRSGCWRSRRRPTPDVEPYPLDVLGRRDPGHDRLPARAGARQRLPFEVPLATLLTMVEVDPRRPGLRRSDQVRRPDLRRGRGRGRCRREGLGRQAGRRDWRRVVPSPRPLRIFEIRPMRWLLERGAMVICAGGGGIPTMYARGKDRQLGRRGGGRRQGPREQPAGARPRRRPVRDGHRCRRRLHGLGHARRSGGSTGSRPTSSKRELPGGVDGSQGRRRRGEFVGRPGNRAAIGSSTRSSECVAGTAGTNVVPADA